LIWRNTRYARVASPRFELIGKGSGETNQISDSGNRRQLDGEDDSDVEQKGYSLSLKAHRWSIKENRFLGSNQGI